MDSIFWLFVLVVAACIQLYRLADAGRRREGKEPSSMAPEEDMQAVESPLLPPPPPVVVRAAVPPSREEPLLGFHSSLEDLRQRSAIAERCQDQQVQVQKKKPRPSRAIQLMARAPGQGSLVIAHEILSTRRHAAIPRVMGEVMLD